MARCFCPGTPSGEAASQRRDCCVTSGQSLPLWALFALYARGAVGSASSHGGGSSPVGSSSVPPTHRDPGAQGQETLYSCISVPLLVLLTWGHPTSPRHAGPCLWVCMRGDMGTRVTVYVQVRASEKSFTET